MQLLQELADLLRAINIDPNDGRRIRSRGLTYLAMSLYEEALAELTRAIQLDPNDVHAVLGRGQAYQAMDRHEEALDDYLRAIKRDPSYVRAMLADYMRAIKRDPSYARTLNVLGIDQEIANIRAQKEAAIDAQNLEKAAVLRDREKQLLARKAALQKKWEARHNVPFTSVEFDRLRDLLFQLGIDAQEYRRQWAVRRL